LDHQLGDDEKVRIGLMADHVVDIIARRYSLEPSEVVDAVKWVQQHKEFVSRMKHGGWLSLLSVIIGALLLSMWEGVKALVKGKQ
jgi:hypothetical protein